MFVPQEEGFRREFDLGASYRGEGGKAAAEMFRCDQVTLCGFNIKKKKK